MKKFIKTFSVICICMLNLSICNAEIDMEKYSRVSKMVEDNWEGNYIEDIKFYIGKNVMLVNGEEKQIAEDTTVVPTVVEGRTMLPARVIIEEIGADISFEPETNVISMLVDDIDLNLKVGDRVIEVQGEKTEIDVAPVIENGRTLLPIRTLSENLGMGIEWNPNNQEITLTNDLQMKRIIVKAKKEMDFSLYNPIDMVDMDDYLYILQFDTMGKTKSAYEDLKANENIEYVELDVILSTQANTTTSNYTYNSWGVERMNVDEYVKYLNKNNKNDEVVVAVIDSGIMLNHEVFNGRIKEGGYDFANGDSDVTDITTGKKTYHGTHVAGIVADLTKGTNVKILPLKVCDSKKEVILSSYVYSAIDYAIKKKVDVINLSLSHDERQAELINRAINNGCVLVYAAGNESESIDSTAKKLSEVIFVSALDSDDKFASSFSCYGNEVDVAAPGVKIKSSYKENGYAIANGTSQAAPHISAVAALYKVGNKNLTVKQITELITKYTDDLGDPGKDQYYGYGIPNMLKSLENRLKWSQNDVKIQEGNSTNVKLLKEYSSGKEEDVTSLHKLAIADTKIAKIENDGKITALSAGETYAYYDSSNSNQLKIVVEEKPAILKVKTTESKGNIIIELSDDRLKLDKINNLSVSVNGEVLLWKGNITSISKSDNKKEIVAMGNDLKIEDGKVTLTAKTGTFLYNRLIINKDPLSIVVDNTDKTFSCIMTLDLKGYTCTICNANVKWVAKETMHALICEKDASHIMQVEGHSINKNKICSICKYEKKKEYKPIFKDYTDKTHWAWDNVGHMVELGILDGKLEGQDRYLKPNDVIKSEEIIVLLARILGYNKVDEIADDAVYNPIESSQSKGEWKYFMKYLTDNGKDAKKEMQILLSNNGISASDEQIKANYKKAISRERVAYLLGGLFKPNNRAEILVDKFEDWGEVNPSYQENLRILSAYDILRGNSTDEWSLYLKPTQEIKTVEAIALIDRFYCLKQLGYTYED